MKPFLDLGALSAALLLLLPASGLAETPPAAPTAWNQEKVTELAGELTKQVETLYGITYRALPDSAMESPQTELRHELIDKLRVIQNEARHLQARLEKGDGLSKTRPIYMRIDELRRDAAEDARRLFLTGDVTHAMEATRDIWLKLRDYYLAH